jgi:hypothetical protein
MANNDFTEETIYLAFIRFCGLQTKKPIPADLKTLCIDKNDNLTIHDTIYDKIRKLKENGKNFTNEQFMRLLHLVGKKNIIPLAHEEAIVFPLRKLQMCMEKILPDATGHLKTLIQNMGLYFQSMEKEDIDKSSRNLKNFLATSNKKQREDIFQYLNTNGKFTKKEKRRLMDILENAMVFNASGSDPTATSIHFMKNYIHDIVSIFPKMMMTNTKYDNIEIPSYWNLSSYHKIDLVKSVQKYYRNLRKTDDNLTPILSNIHAFSRNLIQLLDNTPSFSVFSFQEKAYRTPFDKRLCDLLFEQYFLLALGQFIAMTKKTEFVSLKKNSTEDDLVLRTVENYFDEEKMEEREEDMGNQGTVKNNVADLIAVFLSIMNDHKEKVDLSYEKVIDTVFKTQQREKQTFTDRLQEMTEEERKADTILKITVARWLTPNGTSISEKGLTPDYPVAVTQKDIDAKIDPQMDKAVELLNQ